ncbi:Ribosomal protein S6--L-glutamate ligase [Pseudobythopirellula maris]|uniref:Ribosomal protein S6--L-glutamate ligase n=1 Tax=Pseudobythopirellula maris TaxID=2527991 RepID=A0A5C5ZJ56_9BACT|nr:alpha-L-glutamate ligase-like protein [Pseudobythopirellula maris]TWT87404.1 Ribosomal protein S6--L-glutamate ligase [Pseudobythopirellula maris]
MIDPAFPGSRWFASPSELRRAGVIGINDRNLSLIAEQNHRALYPRVDNKLITKTICEQHGIPVPDTYNVISSQGEVRRILELLGSHESFVIKPASGAAGRGVLVIASRDKEGFHTGSGKLVTRGELRYHVSAILSGLYSLRGQVDQAIVEQRIVCDPSLERVSYGGTPDVRVILYRGVPAMAMVRLPTIDSGGRANLHQGAIAAAIDLGTGVTYGGASRNRRVSVHPDTGNAIAGITIPEWRRLLLSAIRLGDALELGYLGLDFVVDAVRGPVVLEGNARPGLAIQVAHREGLRNRLDWIDHNSQPGLSPEARLGLAERLTRESRPENP